MTYASIKSTTPNVPRCLTESIGADGGDLWLYADGDALGTVTEIGYIRDATEIGLKAGDLVIHRDETNGVVNLLTAVAGATTGTAVGALCSAIEPIGETSIALQSAGTGTFLAGDMIQCSNDTDNTYRVTTGDSDISGGGTLVITPGLVKATAVGTGITVVSDVINLVAQNTNSAETLIAARTLTAADSGKTLYLGVAGGFTVTLPAPLLGLRYRFVVKVAPTTAYIIVTNGGANIMCGGVNELEVDTGDDGPYDTDADTLNFVASVAVVGDFVEMESDGTTWYYRGQTNADGGITTATT